VLLGKKLVVAFPDSVLEEKDSLRDKTTKLGLIARTCVIYGVDVVEVFRDEKGPGELVLIKKILEFLETPQYLRRRLYPMDEALRFAGILPPLRIPSHKTKVPVRNLRIGEVREGVTNGDGTVEIGLDQPARLAGRERPDMRVTVKIRSKNPLTAERISPEGLKEYWGYRVESKSANEVLSDNRFGLKIATSRLGKPLVSLLPSLRTSIDVASGVKLIFGSPSRGLFDIMGPTLAMKSDFVVNLFAEQRVDTVRTEEAIMAGLNLVNVLAAEKA